MQSIPHLKIPLYKQWKFLFTGLIIFWLFVMIIFSVGLISLGGDYGRPNIARKSANRMQYTYELEHMSMADPNFGLVYKLENDHIAYFQNFTNVDNRLLNLTPEGNLTKDFVDLKLNLTESNEVPNHHGENVTPNKTPIISNDSNLKSRFSSLQLINRHRQPVIEDLPRDKISEQQIDDLKNKNWFKDKIFQQNAIKTDDISRQNKAIYGEHVGTPISANDMRLNNDLLKQNRNLYGDTRINPRTADKHMLNLQNRWIKLQNEKRVMYEQPKIRDYRQGGYLSKSTSFQQPDKNQAVQAQQKRNYNMLLNGDQRILHQSNNFFNVKSNRNQIFQPPNRNTYKKALFGIQSENIPFRIDRLILHRKVVPFNIKRQTLLQHGQDSFKNQLFQKQNGDVYRKQGIKMSSPFVFLKEKFIAQNMPKNSVYEQQQQRNLYDKLTRVAAPKLRNPVINYQLRNNLLQKQSGYFSGRERLNGLPKITPVLQKLLSHYSNNRIPISPQSRNAYYEQKQSGYLSDEKRLNGLPIDRPLFQKLLSRYSFNRISTSPQSRNVYKEQKQSGYLSNGERLNGLPIDRPVFQKLLSRYSFNRSTSSQSRNVYNEQKQSGYLIGRERLNGLPKSRPVFQKLLSRDSFNIGPVSPQSRNVYNEQNIKFSVSQRKEAFDSVTKRFE